MCGLEIQILCRESLKEYGRVLHTDIKTRLHWAKKRDRMEKTAWRLQLYW